jgi:hypothetical protein
MMVAKDLQALLLWAGCQGPGKQLKGFDPLPVNQEQLDFHRSGVRP